MLGIVRKATAFAPWEKTCAAGLSVHWHFVYWFLSALGWVFRVKVPYSSLLILWPCFLSRVVLSQPQRKFLAIRISNDCPSNNLLREFLLPFDPFPFLLLLKSRRVRSGHRKRRLQVLGKFNVVVGDASAIWQTWFVHPWKVNEDFEGCKGSIGRAGWQSSQGRNFD